MSSNEFSYLFKLLICLAMIASFEAYQEIKVFRLIQYEAEENVYGSQYTSLNYIGAHYKGDLLRKIGLIKFGDIKDTDDLKQYINSNANAILFILPNKLHCGQCENKLREVQNFLSEQTLYIPVYFTEENEEINNIYNELEQVSREEHPENFTDGNNTSGSLLGYFKLENNLLQFTLSGSDPKKTDNLTLENLYGYLEGSTAGTATNNIIAIVANYDDLSIVPDMPSGLNSNGSGVIAMLEIIRILSKFYENYEANVKYDVLFLLSSGGSLNYHGSNHFINNIDSSILENIQFVLCLDSMSMDENEMFLHLSRFPKQEEDLAYRIHKSLNTTSANMDINLNFKKKKVFLSEKIVPWEHEQFSKKKILTSTLSGRSESVNNFFNSRLILDKSINKTALKKGIKLVLESLFGILFESSENIDIFKDDESLIDEQNIDSLINFFKKYPRSPLNVAKGSIINNDLYTIMNSYLTKMQRQSFEYNDMKFFDQNSGVIKIYTVKSKMIDLYLLFSIIMYLLILYIYVKGFGNFISNLKNAFNEED